MSIEFNEDNFGSRQIGQMPGINTGQKSGSFMVDFLIKHQIVQNAATANIILVVCALICIGLSIYFFIFGFSIPNFNNTPPASAPILEEQIPEGLDY